MLKEDDVQLLPPQVLLALQFRTFSEPLLPNLKSLELRDITDDSISFIPLFLSTRITSILLGFELELGSELPKAVIASLVTSLPTLCPNLQRIGLHYTPRDPMITAAISEMFLATDRNTLQRFHVDSPLADEVREVICKLPNLRGLWLVIDGPAPLPTLVLPNLTAINIEYDDDRSWLQGFRGATLGKLTSVTFRSGSHSIGDILEAFKSVALTTSIPATLSKFEFHTSRPWRPNCRSLLLFTRLKKLDIGFPCGRDCSSTIDDDILTDLARAIPKLKNLRLGAAPCNTPASVTFKGLAALTYHCPRLSKLRIHFRVANFDPAESPLPQGDCALTDLEVGGISVPGGSTSMVALTLLRIFPRLHSISYTNPGWAMVAHAINVTEEFSDDSGEGSWVFTPRSKIDGAPPRSHT